MKNFIKIGAASLVFSLPMSVLGIEEGQALMKGSDCFSCHAVGRKVIGPSFIDVAKKYRSGGAGAIKSLVKKVKEGGSGVWGAVPMAGHPALAEADIEKMIKWVLSQSPAKVASSAAVAPKAPATAVPAHVEAPTQVHAASEVSPKKPKKRHVSHLASHGHENSFLVDTDEQVRKLMQNQDCYGCHSGSRRDGVAEDMPWPNFVKIESKYKGVADIQPLVKKIRMGEGAEKWGKVPHPRYEHIPVEAAEKMVAYIVQGKASKGVEAIDPDKMSAEEWMRKGSDCFSCHAINTKNVGPAYKDVAKKYAGAGAGQIQALVKKVKEGGSGVWGSVAMSAHPTASESQLEKSVRWILEQQ